MVYISYFIFGFAVLQFLVASVNFLFRNQLCETTNSVEDKISILIPARNEEKNISIILNDILNIKDLNIEIVVFNDQSTDETAEIVSRFAEKDPRVQLISSETLPEGWMGKNHACHSLAKKATGKYFLFLDADVRINKDIIHRTILYTKKHQLGLTSIFPKQIMKSLGERITVPNMNYILLSQLPLILVRSSRRPSLAAANGQFMFFESSKYLSILPHQEKRNSKVEDIEIIRLYKSRGIKTACLLGDDTITCRMYTSFGEAVDGFSKNAIMFFGNSFLFAILFYFITNLGFVFIYKYLSIPFFFIYIALKITMRTMISMISHQNWLGNLILMIAQQVSFGIFIIQALKKTLRKQHQWKGRNI